MSIFVAFFSTYNLYSLFFRWAETHRLVARYFRYGFFSFGWFCPTRGTQSSAAATFASSLSPSELKRVLAQAWGFRLAGPGLKAQTWILSLKVPGSILVTDIFIEKQISQPIFLNTKSKFVLHFQDAVEIWCGLKKLEISKFNFRPTQT